MRAEIYPIAEVPCGRLAIMPRPRAGDWLADEVASWRKAGVDCVVSLLEPAEVDELGLQHESALCEDARIVFRQFPIPDRGVPHSDKELLNLIEALVLQLRADRGVAIHCRIGVGRSALVAACVLAALGQPVEAAWRAIETARRQTVPDTYEQREWVTAFCARVTTLRGRPGA